MCQVALCMYAALPLYPQNAACPVSTAVTCRRQRCTWPCNRAPQKKVAIARLVMRAGNAPTLVALEAQEEETDSGGVQVGLSEKWQLRAQRAARRAAVRNAQPLRGGRPALALHQNGPDLGLQACIGFDALHLLPLNSSCRLACTSTRCRGATRSASRSGAARAAWPRCMTSHALCMVSRPGLCRTAYVLV